MSNIQELETNLNDMILSGDALAAFDRYYAPNVVMQENSEEPRVGKEANRAYEEQFFSMVKEVHSMSCDALASHGDVSFSEWSMDLTFQDGTRVQRTQVARRKWQDGQIIEERFFFGA